MADGERDPGLLDGLVQLSFAIQAALGRVAEKHDLSLVQVRLLGILRDREPSMMELAAFLGLDKSSVTGLVSRAERRGLVERHAASEDRRGVHVIITPKGRQVATSLAKHGERELASLVGALSDADRKRLSWIATRIVADDARRDRG